MKRKYRKEMSVSTKYPAVRQRMVMTVRKLPTSPMNLFKLRRRSGADKRSDGFAGFQYRRER